MRELLFFPALDENGMLNAHYVESEKQLQCDTIRARKNHPHGYALDCCRRLMYENEPCGVSIYGTEEEVMRVTPEILTAHWRALCKDLHLHAFYVGASDVECVRQTLCSAFDLTQNSVELCTPTGAVISLTDPASIRPHTPTLVREEELAVKQGQLVIGLRTGAAIQSEEFFACALFNELLGASPVSKLFVNVREKLGLCYSCSSAYNAYKASILISCGIENENRELAEREILAQINAIAAGAFSDEEWNAAQKSMENAYRQLEDSPVGMENYYFGRALAGLSVDPTLACARFAALKREDVMRVAKGVWVDTIFFLRQVGGEEEVCDDED
jgi:predicted Zn-dependent peptidase